MFLTVWMDFLAIRVCQLDMTASEAYWKIKSGLLPHWLPWGSSGFSLLKADL